MTPALFAGLFFHFMLLSLIAIGGFMATLPGMYSYLVDTAGLLTPETFAKTVAFGQSLPGPNVLVAAVLGWAAAAASGRSIEFMSGPPQRYRPVAAPARPGRCRDRGW